jgi:uncharacterized protein YgiM (DUF1202 family)
MLSRVQETIKEVLGDLSLDSRLCYTDVRLDPPDGREMILECSDAAALEEIRRRLPLGELPEGVVPRFVALPDPLTAFPEIYMVVNSVADVRRTPAHQAELVTQAICGDPVAPLREEGDWTLVRLEDGYHGWIRDWHLRPMMRLAHTDLETAASWRIAENIAQVLESPGGAAFPVCDAVIGTPVIVGDSQRRGWRHVTLPDGRSGHVRSRAVERRPRRRVSRERLVATGLGFVGIPYLWGGTTPKGFDCSGLIQTIFRLCGVRLPRDSDLQARHAPTQDPGDIGALKTGNLLFFGPNVSGITHVAMYLSDGDFLHAHGRVRVNSLKSTDPQFDKKLAMAWRSTSDPFSL